MSQTLKDFCATHKVVLGSSSKWRRQVLESQGVKLHSCMSPDIDENAIRHPDPNVLPLLIARGKADALEARCAAEHGSEELYLICSDQVAYSCGEIREKPKDSAMLETWVRQYIAGNPVETYSAVVVVNTRTKKRAEGVDVAKTFFKADIPESVVKQIAVCPDIITCSGGFAVDDKLMGPYVDHIEGAMDSVVGLPLELLDKLLHEAAAA
eukprot:GDKI01046630.1.p1 GENE.GDKI01046630.1~~GDKI01046630.1.p1  ORF type:complete len:210 (+),score=58.42 GDKI01046630.1:85-714(+)